MSGRRALFLGRFQPYHNGHQRVIEKIARQADELIIAVGSAQWSHTLRDPFTAGERIMMIHRALEELSLIKYVLPVEDIERNSLYVSHILTLTPAFQVVYSNNPLVVRLFKEAEIKVHSLPFVERDRFWGTKIRELMIAGDEWRAYVPAPVAGVIDEIDGITRLRQIHKTDHLPEKH